MDEIISTISNWFQNASGLANFFGITTPIAGVAFALNKFLKQRKSEPSIHELSEIISHNQNRINLKKIGKIAFVDDEIQDFPITELKKANYQISTYKQVSLADVTDLATYDVIFLDIKGVVKDDPEEGGLKLLSSLRKLNPNQKICAVSNKQYDVLATRFFEQADDVAKKPMTAQKCSDQIDQFLSEKFKLEHIEESITSELSRLDKGKRAAFLRSINELIKNQNDPRPSLNLDRSAHPKLHEAAIDFVRMYRNAT
ncbi:hypothetical protein PKB_2062 [Pseudomonas knackmussii B13]|uniref:Response regulatory domain-containing protein n=1 Tax=Pseudomonas knackmussii (strain DSM 6978 / CCUG 54928 / LMG 23759 / B13) TaxID=1301098 RepID=A0A024HFK3_PSEKB|nr:hypothetical protein [Pseudomonas knackmussii]CDF83409.1 hypothetical protein PKB_2062 [Pseudomonas knackmussii B13]